MTKIRFTKRNIALLIAFIILGINLVNYLTTSPSSKDAVRIPTPSSLSASLSSELFRVARVIDGDTIELENKRKVRYIGINTPELHDPRKPVECFGREAMEENKQLVEGKRVRLEKDVSETDKYKRLLRYVYVTTDASPSGLFVNDYLVREGYAYADTFPPDVKYANYFLQLQREAIQNKKGLWSKCQ